MQTKHVIYSLLPQHRTTARLTSWSYKIQTQHKLQQNRTTVTDTHTNTWLKYTHIPVYIHNNNTVHCTLSKYLQCTQYTCVYNKNIAAAGVVHRVPENTAHVIFTHHLPKLRKNYNFHPQVSGQPVIKYMYNFPHHLTIYYLLYHVIMLGIREQKFSRLTYNYNTFWKCLY